MGERRDTLRLFVRDCALGAMLGILWAIPDCAALLTQLIIPFAARAEAALAAMLIMVPTGALLGGTLSFWLGAIRTARVRGRARTRQPWTAFALQGAALLLPLGVITWGVAATVFGGPGVGRTIVGKLGPPVVTLVVSLSGLASLFLVEKNQSKFGGSRRWGYSCLALGLAATAVFQLIARVPQVDVRPYLLHYVHGLGLTVTWLLTRQFRAFRPLEPLYITPAVVFACLIAAPWALSSDAARHGYWSVSHSTKPHIRVLQTLSDADGDGYSSLYGGGDCEPFDASVFPLALDLDDGKDTDCNGHDGPPPGSEIPPAPYGSVVSKATGTTGTNNKQQNVVVILIDALRADIFNDADIGRFESMLRLRKESQWFTNAFAPAPSTMFSLPSMMTGYGSDSRTTFVEVLKRNGMTTAVVCPESVQIRLPKQSNGGDLFDREFVVGRVKQKDTWGRGVSAPLTDETVHVVRRELQSLASTQPFLFWIHLYSAHQWKTFGGEGSSPHERYNSAVAQDDRAVREILLSLQQNGLEDRTIVVLASDHGQGLNDRGWETHTLVVHPEIARVPLLLKIPEQAPGTVRTVVASDSMFPTVLELLGIQSPNAAPSLLPLIKGKSAPDGAPYPVATIGKREQSVILGDLVLVRLGPGNASSLFPLSEYDLFERRNIIESRPQAATAMLFHLANAQRRVMAKCALGERCLD